VAYARLKSIPRQPEGRYPVAYSCKADIFVHLAIFVVAGALIQSPLRLLDFADAFEEADYLWRSVLATP
jgi:hypothetical protein